MIDDVEHFAVPLGRRSSFHYDVVDLSMMLSKHISVRAAVWVRNIAIDEQVSFAEVDPVLVYAAAVIDETSGYAGRGRKLNTRHIACPVTGFVGLLEHQLQADPR